MFWGALWAQLIPQPPSDNCSHKHCALIGSPLCCALSAPPPPEMEPWIFRFKAEGTVDYSQLTFDPGQNELIVGARYRKPAFFFRFFLKIPSGLSFSFFFFFSCVLLLSCLLFPSVWVRAVTDFSVGVFKTGIKMLWGLLSLSSPAKRACVLMCLLQYLLDCDTESKKGFHKFSAKYFCFFPSYLLWFIAIFMHAILKNKAPHVFG